MSDAVRPPPLGLSDLEATPKRARRERTVRMILQAAAMISVVVSGAIVFSLLFEA